MSVSESRGWTSSENVVVGNPSPAFEARLVKPEFDSSLYRPDTAIDGWSNGRVVVRAASVRGYQHRYDGSPRQDDFALLSSDDGHTVFLAVADGLSSARNSHVGSSYATRYAVRWLNQSAASKAKETEGGRIDWSQMLSDCVRSTSWFLLQETARLFGVDKDVRQAARLTATTLVCAAVVTKDDPVSVYSVSVGDSGAWILADGEFTPLSGGKSLDAGGIADSSVQHFLPGGIPETFDVAHQDLVAGSVLLLGSDGFGDPLGRGRGAVGDLFRETFQGRVPSRHEFAHVLDFQRETFDDDRTLVGVWPGTGEEALSAVSPRRRQQARRDRRPAVVAPPTGPEPPDGSDLTEQGAAPSSAESQEQPDQRATGAGSASRPSPPDAQARPGTHDARRPAPQGGTRPRPTDTDPSVGRSRNRRSLSRAYIVEMTVVAVIAAIVGFLGGRYVGQDDQPESVAPGPSESSAPESAQPDASEPPVMPEVPESVAPVTSESSAPESAQPDASEPPVMPEVPESVPPVTSESSAPESEPARAGDTTTTTPTTSTARSTTTSTAPPSTTSTARSTTTSTAPPSTTSTARSTTTSTAPPSTTSTARSTTTSTAPPSTTSTARSTTTSTAPPSTTAGIVQTAPDAPSLILSLSGDDGVTASWDSPDGGAPVEGFRLEWLGSDNPYYVSEWSKDSSDRSLEFAGLPCGIDVVIGIQARNSVGLSEQESQSIKTQSCGEPEDSGESNG